MAGAVKSAFDTFVDSLPLKKEFTIDMAADSTTEVWDDIDTDMPDGYCWAVYGIEWDLECANPALPSKFEAFASHNVYQLQVHRNDDNTEMLLKRNDALLLEHKIRRPYVQNAAGEVFAQFETPFRHAERTITFAETLRVMFVTAADDVSISQIGVYQISGFIFYDLLEAGKVGSQTKLGRVAKL